MCLCVIVLINFYGLQNFWHIKTPDVFFYHATHTESRSGGSNSLLHVGNPTMRNTIVPVIVVGWNNLLLEQCIQGETIGLVLHVLVMIFAFLANRPAVLAVIALGPPTIENTAIRLPIERRFLAAGSASLVRTNGVVQPEIRARNQVASHCYIVVFQENDFSAECVAA